MRSAFHLFEAAGVELEYALVRESDLSVLPVSDKVLFSAAGDYSGEAPWKEISWSNEFVLHVIELKINDPRTPIKRLPSLFHRHVRKINRILGTFQGRMLPGGCHPFMNPARETMIWPHDNSIIYQTFHRIFGCRGHGWSNLQSAHLNLPFCGDREFAKLHAAVRLVLPIIPALSASSPLLDGRATGFLDSRLAVYQRNQRKIPSIAGRVVPEPVFSRKNYGKKILRKMYADIAPLDKKHVLQHEWLNSRGAIARFERNSIEIRILDTQECPRADMAVISAVIEAVRALTMERWTSLERQKAWSEKRLARIYQRVVRDAERAEIRDGAYLAAFGYSGNSACTARQLWEHIIREVMPGKRGIWEEPLSLILRQGTLARRILKALRNDYSRKNLVRIYGKLADCLERDRLYE